MALICSNSGKQFVFEGICLPVLNVNKIVYQKEFLLCIPQLLKKGALWCTGNAGLLDLII